MISPIHSFAPKFHAPTEYPLSFCIVCRNLCRVFACSSSSSKTNICSILSGCFALANHIAIACVAGRDRPLVAWISDIFGSAEELRTDISNPFASSSLPSSLRHHALRCCAFQVYHSSLCVHCLKFGTGIFSISSTSNNASSGFLLSSNVDASNP